MIKIQLFLRDSIIWTEFLCAFIALWTFKKVRHSQWKWFSIYLIVIFLLEFTSNYLLVNYPTFKKDYYAYFVIPLEFIFFFWLYAHKSLKKRELFIIFTMLYLLSFIPHKLFFEKTDIVYSVNYTFGCFLLMILVALEFNHQIQSDDILNYNKNKMFYINLGVVLFYIGTLPFFTFYGIFIKDMNMWNYYYTYFLIFNNVMYLLFATSLLWGKQK